MQNSESRCRGLPLSKAMPLALALALAKPLVEKPIVEKPIVEKPLVRARVFVPCASTIAEAEEKALPRAIPQS